MSTSGENNFEDYSFQYPYNQPSYSMDHEIEEIEDHSDNIILPDEHYIANFSANGIKPQIPSFELDDDEEDTNTKGKTKKARAKSDSRYIVRDGKNKSVIEKKGDGLLHPDGFGNHKCLHSTDNVGVFVKVPEMQSENNLEMPNLLSKEFNNKVLMKRFKRAIRVIGIIKRLSSRSSVSSSNTYNNDISDTSSLYSTSITNTHSKMNPKNTLSVGTHSRTSSIASSRSNLPTPSVSSEILDFTPSSNKEVISPTTRSLMNAKSSVKEIGPISPMLTEPLTEPFLEKEKGKKENKNNCYLVFFFGSISNLIKRNL